MLPLCQVDDNGREEKKMKFSDCELFVLTNEEF